jgi:hypothetical protein
VSESGLEFVFEFGEEFCVLVKILGVFPEFFDKFEFSHCYGRTTEVDFLQNVILLTNQDKF